MKKILIAALILLAANVKAQIAVTINGGLQVSNNQVFNYNTVNDASKLSFIITNTSEETLNIKIKCQNIDNTNGSNFQLCFGGFCYYSITEGITYPTNFYVTLEPGDSTTAGDHFWNNNAGAATFPLQYDFTFVRVNDNSVYMNDLLSLSYRYGPNLGTTQFGTLSDMGIKVANTKVTNDLLVETTAETALEIYSVTGQLVKKATVSGSNTVDVSALAPAVYVVKFTDKQNRQGSIRIIKG